MITEISNDIKTTVDNWFGALGKGDGEGALKILDENVVWTNTSPENHLSDIIPWLGQYKGRSAVAETFTIWAELSQVEEFEVINIFYNSDEAMAIIHEKALIKSTGLNYDIEFVQRLKIKSDKIIAWTSYWDTSKGIVAFRGDIKSRLPQAVKSGDQKTVEMLLNASGNPNESDPESPQSLLLVAAGKGDNKMVKILLKEGANPNILDAIAGTAPIHKACQSGNLDVVKSLVECGAFLNLQTAHTGHTPLMEAVWYKHVHIVKYLLDLKVGLNLRTHYGFTLDDHLQYALTVNPQDQEKLRKIKELVSERRKLDEAFVGQQTLIQAVLENNLEKVNSLLKSGADVDERYPNLDGFNDQHTPLLVAAREGHVEILEMLIKYGADINAVEETFGAVPLHKATYNGHLEITKILAAQPGILLDFQGASNGYTPLHDALWHGFADCARALVEAGADSQ